MVHSEPEDLGTRSTLCHVVLLVSCDSGHCKSLGIAHRGLAFTIYYIIYRSAVVPVENAYIKDILSEECLLADLRDNVFSIIMDDDDLRKIRAVADVLGVILLLEVGSDEALRLVCIKLRVVAYDLR